MKNILRLILSLTSLTIVSANSLIIIGCGENTGFLTQNDYASIYKKYFYGYPYVNADNPYYSFINSYAKKTKIKASKDSMQKFDNLQLNPVWNSFSQLEEDLTTTKLSKRVTIEVNWNKLYRSAGLNQQLINKADNLQLKFYNAIAKVYHKSNIIRLVQKIQLADIGEKDFIAYTSYYSNIAAQTQTFGKNFVNQKVIDSQYNINFWNSNHLNGVSVHEYGHALSNYIAFSVKYRNYFNTISADNVLTYKENMLNNANIYSDITQVLMYYLDTKININAVNETDRKIKNFFFPLIVVNSGYSSISFLTGNVSQRNEFLAEAFSLWLATDDDKRTWNWELLNEFFMDYLPKYGKLNIKN